LTIFKDFLLKTWKHLKLDVDADVNATNTDPPREVLNSSFFNENSSNLKEYDKDSLENEITLNEFIGELGLGLFSNAYDQ